MRNARLHSLRSGWGGGGGIRMHQAVTTKRLIQSVARMVRTYVCPALPVTAAADRSVARSWPLHCGFIARAGERKCQPESSRTKQAARRRDTTKSPLLPRHHSLFPPQLVMWRLFTDRGQQVWRYATGAKTEQLPKYDANLNPVRVQDQTGWLIAGARLPHVSDIAFSFLPLSYF